MGIAVHCGGGGERLCAKNANAQPDLLPDEPGGYEGFKALFGAKYVDPAITGGAAVRATTRRAARSPTRPATAGSRASTAMLAENTLGYVEQMQETGVPVTYAYISDAHDATRRTWRRTPIRARHGPGRGGAQAQLKAYDDAFAAVLRRTSPPTASTKSNTLFAITVDEGDHFAGGAGIPQPDGTLGVHARATAPT